MAHELARAETGELSARQLEELSNALAAERTEVQALVDVIRESYPEISDKLFGELTHELDAAASQGTELDLQALAKELATLEDSGYLSHEETLRLNKALNALHVMQEGGVAWNGEDVIVAQAEPAEGAGKEAAKDGGKPQGDQAAGKAGHAGADGQATGAAEGGAAAGAGGEEVAIEALPATGAGPLVALAPVLAGGAAVAVAASSTSSAAAAAADTTAPVAPTFALTADTGSSSTDGITSNGQVTVSGLESGATWQYSTNSGTSWTTGSGTTFTLAANTYSAGAVKVRQTDAAGNTSTAASNGSAITVDTTAPVAQSLTQNGSTQLVINYDSTLDAAHAAGTSAFTVTANSVAVGVTSVSVSGSAVTLNLASALTTGQSISVKYTDPTAGNDTNATQDIAGNDAATTTTGKVADGYVRGAQIYIDTNGNGVAEDSEILNGVKTDANGNFFLPDNAPSGAILAVGGVNIDTGVPNTTVLKAPAGATVISPLTTLVQAYLDANPSASAATANTAVLSALSLPTGSGIDLSTYDPLTQLQADPSSAQALAVQKAAAQVATLVELAAKDAASGNGTTAGSTVINNLVSQISSAASGGTTISLTDTTVLTNVLTGAVNNVATVTSSANTANTNISGASTISAVSSAQAVALDHTPPATPTVSLDPDFDTGSSSTDGVTKLTSPDVRVTFNTTATDGTAAVAGDKVKLYMDGSGTPTATYTLTATDIGRGYVDFSVSGLSGTKSFTATITDLANNVSTAMSSGYSVTIDTTAPAAPSIALASDTGSNSGDLITSNGTVNVTGLENGASWKYSTDGGSNWTNGSGTSFVLSGDGAKSVLVQQIDVAGNSSASSTALNFTLDATAPGAPVVSTVAGNDNVDGPESLADITISGTAQANSALTVIWSNVRLTTTADGTGAWSVTVPSAQIPADGNTTVVALATDAAGNISAAGTRAVTIASGRADTTAPDAPVVNTVAGNDIVNAAEKAAGVTLTGTAESGATVRITWGSTTQTTTAAVDGSWSSTFASSAIPATGNITVTATDHAATPNTSTVTTHAVTIDTAAPAAPTIALASDTGSSNSDLTTSNGTINVSGLEGGASWQYSTDGGSNWTAGSGSSFTLSGDGAKSVLVRQIDAAGNTGATVTRTVTLDTAAPTAPTIAAVSTDNRVSASEKSAGVAVTGTAEAGSSVAVTWGSNTKTAIADASGAWSTSFSSSQIPADGSSTITAVATDVAGNASSAGSRSVSIDTVAPTTLTIGTVAGDDRVSVAERSAGVTVSGTAELGSTVTLTWGSVTKTVTVGATGSWSSTFSSSELPAADGSTQTISATVKDLAGNVSASATTHPVVMQNAANSITGVTAANLLTAAASYDSIGLAANQTFNLTAADYLGTPYQDAFAKVTNAVSEYTVNVDASAATAAQVLSIGANANVDAISLANGQTLSITASQYSSNATALGKISSAAANYTLDVTGVTATNFLSIAGDSKVDHVTLVSGQTLGLTPAQYTANSAALDKISNATSDYTLNLTGVTSSNFVDAVTAGTADARIDNIVVGSGQTVGLTLAQYNANSAGLAKINTAVADYTLNVSGAAASDFLTVAADSKVDGITLNSGATLDLTAAQYTSYAAKIGNAAADFTLNVSGGVTSANALTIGANAKVDSVTLDASQAFTLSLTDYNAAQTAFGKISNPVTDYSVTLSIATADEATDIATLVSQGNASGRIDVLDVQDNAITITDVQAEALAVAGVHFASDDVVTVTATGNHLQSSLSNLQKLGVDALTVTSSDPGFGIPLGSDPINFSTLPAITAPDAVRVGLVIPDSYLGTLEAPTTIHAAELKAAGFDAIFAADGSLTLDATQTGELKAAGLGYRLSDDITMSIRPGGETTAIASLVSSIDGGVFTTGAIDHLNVYDNAIDITAAQATSLVNAGLDFATEDTVTVNAVGTQLHTSLSGLQHLGVDVLNISGVTGSYDIAVGTSTIDFTHLPTINADASVQVNLQLDDNATTGTTISDVVSNAAALKAAGIDAISAADGNLTLSGQQVVNLHTADLILDPANTVTMRISSGQEADAINTLTTNISTSHYPGDLDILDVIDNSITITDAQASLLAGANLQFSAEDTVAVQATGTHLQTSLSNLQHLGVDVINVAATSGTFAIDAGTGTVDFTHLPTIVAADGVRVGLEVTDGYFGTLTAPLSIHAADLKAAGFDAIFAADGSLTLDATQTGEIKDAGLGYRLSDDITMSIRPLGESTAIASVVDRIDQHLFTNGAIDHLDVYDNAIDITDAQAHSLVTGGLNFAASDTGVAVHAAGTHLTTSLTDLQHLGVDYVHTGAGADTVVVEMGSGSFTSNVLPVFDAEDHVKMVAGDTQLSTVESLIGTISNDPHIDELSVVLNTTLGTTQGLVGNGILDAALQNAFNHPGQGFEIEVANSSISEVTLGMVLNAADGSADSLQVLSGDSLVAALQAAGINDISVQSVTHFQVADSDLKPLMDAGLIRAEAGADVTVTNSDGSLDVSLAQLANIGADHVQTTSSTATTLQVDAGVSFSDGAGLTAALNQLVSTFEAQGTGGATGHTLFEQADTVDLHVAGSLPTYELGTDLVAKLQLLGIDDIKDADGHSLKPPTP